jgi:hypothetical protein
MCSVPADVLTGMLEMVCCFFTVLVAFAGCLVGQR